MTYHRSSLTDPIPVSGIRARPPFLRRNMPCFASTRDSNVPIVIRLADCISYERNDDRKVKFQNFCFNFWKNRKLFFRNERALFEERIQQGWLRRWIKYKLVLSGREIRIRNSDERWITFLGIYITRVTRTNAGYICRTYSLRVSFAFFSLHSVCAWETR